MKPVALIVDDNALNLETLALLLHKEGITPVQVQYPRDLPTLLEQQPAIDVVFLDLEFPNASGFQLLDQLRPHPRLAGVPIVAYTVHISEQNEARDAGFHSFIGKPLSPERFPDQIRRILDGIPVWEVW